MAEVSTRPSTGTKPAARKPAATAPSSGKHQPASQRRPKPALPEPIDAQDVLERIGDIGVHWWSIIDSVLETHHFHAHAHPKPLEPLPQWAVDRLMDQGRHQDSNTEHRQKLDLLEDWLHLAAGDGSQYCYEVWTPKGERLAFRHESWEEAAATLHQLKPSHSKAFIARVHVLSAPYRGRDDAPALLDTLIGTVCHIGTSFGNEEDRYTVQDETGRQVTVLAHVLAEHPVCDRLDKRGKDSLDFYLNEYKQRQEKIREVAIKARASGEQHERSR